MGKHNHQSYWVSNGLGTIMLLLVTACHQQDTSNPVELSIRLASDTASAPLAESLLNAYESKNIGGTPLTLTQLEHQPALTALQSSEMDALFLAHPPEQEGLFFTPIANELLIIVANPELPIDSLSLDQVRGIFTGHISSWNNLGGPAISIQAITREQETSTRQAFETLVMEGQPITRSARLATDEQDMLELVNATPGGIGYVAGTSLSLSEEQVILLSVDGAPPTHEAARRRAYRLMMPVFFVAPSEPQGTLRNLLDWILSPEGQTVIRRQALGLND